MGLEYTEAELWVKVAVSIMSWQWNVVISSSWYWLWRHGRHARFQGSNLALWSQDEAIV